MKHHHATTSPAKPVAPRAAAESTAQSTASTTGDAKDEFVRQAAYYYYESRGRIGGHELDDWLRAEAEFERTRVEGATDAPSSPATH
jgi:tRNA 2-selenouridine synthase SelU